MTDPLLLATARDVFGAHTEPAELWAMVDELGFPALGAEGTLVDLAAIARVAGEHAAEVPIVEALAANRVTHGDGSATVAFVDSLDGPVRATRVPWASFVDRIVFVSTDGAVASARRDACTIEPGWNLADEPRETVSTTDVQVEDGEGSDAALVLALLRTAQMAGALDRILALTVEYANQREQFGRPISAFQAVQHHLAELAGITTAVRIGVDAAAHTGAPLAIAAAKAHASDSVGRAVAVAHQVHGAIGVTREHQLQRFTRRLWSWRDEAGNEQHWGARIGEALAEAPTPWVAITAAR